MFTAGKRRLRGGEVVTIQNIGEIRIPETDIAEARWVLLM